MESAQTPNRLHAFPVENIALDVIVVLLLSLRPPLAGWVSKNLLLAFWFAAPVQVVGLACAMGGYRRHVWPQAVGLMRYADSLYPLAMLLSAGGFMWMFIPAFAIDTGAAWGAFTAQFFISVFGGVLAVGGGGLVFGAPGNWPHRALTAVGGLAYLLFAESLLYTCAQTGRVSGGIAVLGLALSYLPIRMLFALRPPYRLIDVASALAAFGYVLSSFFP